MPSVSKRVRRVAHAMHATADRAGHVPHGSGAPTWLQNYWCAELFSGLLWDAADDVNEDKKQPAY